MNNQEVTVIYEYAAALMPSDGKWNKPSTAGELLAHTHALRNLPFQIACMAVTIAITRDGTWPAPWVLLRVAKEISSDMSLEKAKWAYESEINEAVADVQKIAQVILASDTSAKDFVASRFQAALPK